MAYTAGGLSLISSVNGFGLYRYDSTDALTDVDDPGYFNNTDDDLNLAPGDIIWVFDWDTAVRTGTLADVGMVVVLEVGSDGAVNCSTDNLVATVTYGS